MHFIIGVSWFRKHFKTTATQCNYIPDDGDENTNIKIAIFLKILLYFWLDANWFITVYWFLQCIYMN